MLRRLYNWTMSLAAHRRASWGLAGVSFAESSFFPIPPDVILIPMILADRRKAFRYAVIATVFSVLGGLAGYAIGAFLFETVGRPLLEFYGALDKFAEFSLRYNEEGGWIVFFFGVTPFPYKVITVASGATALNLVTFTAASVAARGLRFFLVAALLWWFGEPIRRFIERYLGILVLIFMVCLVGGFVAVRYFL
ncbi:YqaA family protein [Minwuia thermotolerans]|uniref:Cytochrome B n=1 Tax=Minwuia thermotolerans TaxID=2056226 RepID=A0A2M9FWC2_9PROT|nr:YqaA family protein [Minwuia thermotolerans]PJK27766.1 cytochrome B [Minwuia thermotolerans]